MTSHKAIHWFRKGLRLHDNPALIKAIEHSTEVYPVFVLDPWFAKSAKVGINRWRFLLQSLKDLDNGLKALNLRLFVVRGNPEVELERLCSLWKISKLTFETDTEPYAVLRDERVESKLRSLGVDVIKCVSHTLYDVHQTVKANGGKVPLTYQGFQSVVSKMGTPPEAVGTPTCAALSSCKTPIGETHDQDYGVPTLAELGKSENDCGPLLYPGGETEALDRMERHLKKINWICTFEKPNTSSNSIVPSTTVLSPYIKFGCLSSRLFYHRLEQVYRGKKHTAPPVSLHGQMLWREFFYTVAASTPNFDRMQGNSVCRQIPWGSNEDHLSAWTHVFEELLLDADWSLNAGNWMWLSASAFFNQYFRVYSPIAFGKKTDPNGDYIKKYIPILKKYPSKYIYEPWKAPLSVQQTAGCVVGKDYPRPIVDHDVAREANLKKMSEAYAKAKQTASKDKVTKRKAQNSDKEEVSEEKSSVSTSKKFQSQESLKSPPIKRKKYSP